MRHGEELEYPRVDLVEETHAINYHAVQEVVAAGLLQVGKDTMMNLADLLMKVMTSERRYELCQGFMW